MDRRNAAVAVSARRPRCDAKTCALGGALLAYAVCGAAFASDRAFVGYYPSWICASPLLPDCLPAKNIAAISPAYTHVNLSFAQPDFAWDGVSWNGSGLQFRQTPAEIEPAIAALRSRGTHVLLAVGGAKYLNWAPLAAEADAAGPITKALVAAINDLGLDGLDIDDESDDASPQQIAEYAGAIRAMHRAVTLAGPGKILTLAAWSTGADCTPQTGLDACGGKASLWQGRAGRERLLFRDATLFATLSMISVMSYDAGSETFDAVTAYALYRGLVPSRVIVNIGFEPAPEGWGDGTLVADDADAACAGSIVVASQFGTPVNLPYSVDRLIRSGPLAARRNSNPRDGAMLWHVLKDEELPDCGGKPAVSAQQLQAQVRVLLDGTPGAHREAPHVR
jgi:hypothetical protein